MYYRNEGFLLWERIVRYFIGHHCFNSLPCRITRYFFAFPFEETSPGAGEAFLAQGLLLGQSTVSMCISLPSPLAQLEVALIGLTLLPMGTSKSSLSHFPPSNWWQTQAIPNAPCSGCRVRMALSASVTFL